jgi:hypothetical protein
MHNGALIAVSVTMGYFESSCTGKRLSPSVGTCSSWESAGKATSPAENGRYVVGFRQ